MEEGGGESRRGVGRVSRGIRTGAGRKEDGLPIRSCCWAGCSEGVPPPTPTRVPIPEGGRVAVDPVFTDKQRTARCALTTLTRCVCGGEAECLTRFKVSVKNGNG